MTTDRENLIDVVDSFDTAMLVTNVNHEPNGRPMAIAQHDDGTMWFITNRHSPKADEVNQDAEALVTLQSRTAHAMLLGTAAMVDDRAKLEKLWNKGAELYFPDGPSTPAATLLRFTPKTGQYWDTRGTKGLQYAADVAQAWWKGERVEQRPNTEGEARL